jgi:hypothetical protein
LPSIIAIPLSELEHETHPIVRAWRVCDTTELLLKLIVSIGTADLRSRGDLPKELRAKAGKSIPHPTLWSWYDFACEVSEAAEQVLGNSAIVPELRSSMRDVLGPLVTGPGKNQASKPRVDNSVLGLRNQLAHGAGVSSAAIARILPAHRSRLIDAIVKLTWLQTVRLLALGENGRIVILSGIRPRLAETEGDFSGDLVKAFGAQKGDVALHRGLQLLFLWPMHVYERPEVQRNNSGEGIKGDDPVPLVYTRLEGREWLEMTPLGSDLATSELHGSAVARLEDLFHLREKRLVIGHTPDDFKAEFSREAAALVGRAEIRETIVRAVFQAKRGVLWVHGPPGSGKSAVMAAVAMSIEDSNDPNLRLIAYRFTANSPRSTRIRFLRYAIRRLNNWQGGETSIDPGEDPDQLGVELSRLIRGIRPPLRLIFLIDGLDEIVRTDPDFPGLPIRYQRDGVVWLCAGRADPFLQRPAIRDQYRALFPGDGLVGLSDYEINEWLKRDAPPLRRDEIARLESNKAGVIPWVLNVCRRSKGLPLYISLVLKEFKTSDLIVGHPVPPDIVSYFDKFLARAGVDDPATTMPVLLAAIALAVEAPDSETLAEVLRRGGQLRAETHSTHDAIIQEAISRARTMLRVVKRPSEGPDGYLPYHDEFAVYIKTALKLANARAVAANGWRLLSLDSSGLAETVRRYSFAISIRQLVALGDEESAIRLFANLSYHRQRLSVGGETQLTNDLAVVDALASYRKDGLFEHYVNFLGRAARESNWLKTGLDPQERRRYAAAFLVRLAGIVRRRGAPLEAKHSLERCMKALTRDSKISADALADLARVEYELGYIHFLSDDPDAAAAVLDSSVRHATLSGDEIGAWIGRCVRAGFEAQFGRTTYEAFDRLLLQALEFFRNESWSPIAERWVMNVLMSRFNVAFFHKDAIAAEERFREFSEHPWLGKFGSTDFASPYLARMRILRGDFRGAIFEFESFLYGADGQPKQNPMTEGLAREFFDFGDVLARSGDVPRARQAWQYGLGLPENCGNRIWKEKIRDALGRANHNAF